MKQSAAPKALGGVGAFACAALLILAGCGRVSLPALPPAAPTTTQSRSAAPPASTLTPPPSPTAVPTPTDVPHAMSIESARLATYPGSQITIERPLGRGSNYGRYYASYLSDGLTIFGLLTIPDGDVPEGGWPAIVFNHGYIPPDVYRTTERYVAYLDRLASSGYIVFRIDYRGHDQSEGEAGGAYGQPGYLADVLNAFSSLKRFPSVNPDSIGMWGHSMGGYLTLRAMVTSPEVKVGVIWAGVVASYPEMLYSWRRTGSFTPSPSSRGRGWRTEWLEQFGTPDENPMFWNSISATSYLQELSGPLQLHHGTADEDVPVEFSVRLAELARAAGSIADLYTYQGDNHNISGNFTLAMDRSIDFFDRYLK